MDLIYAALILLGLRHPAPAEYHAPVRTLPLIVENDDSVIQMWEWGQTCSR